MEYYLLYFVTLFSIINISYSVPKRLERIPYNITIHKDGLEANFTDNFSTINRPIFHHYHTSSRKEITRKRDVPNSNQQGTNYNKFIVETFGDPPDSLTETITAATDIWSEILLGVTIPIEIHVHWTSLSNSNALAAAGPRFIYLYDNTFYCDAQINQLTNTNQSPDTEDIILYINSQFGGSWYFSDGNDDSGPQSGQYDALTVILHEMGHGLGMVGLINKYSGSDTYYYNSDYLHSYIYDKRLVNVDEELIVNEDTINDDNQLTNTLLNAIDGDGVYFYTESVNVPNPKLYTPNTHQAGSSIYHLDESTYPNGNLNSLMTPYLNSGERILTPGPLGLALLESMGWETRDCSEYSSNCNVCINACCSWCSSTQKCVDPAFSSEQSGETCSVDNVCDSCTADSDCDDVVDLCRMGKCISGSCHYDDIVCYDDTMTNNCTTGVCDSSIGCIFVPVDHSKDILNDQICNINANICKLHLEYINNDNNQYAEVDKAEIERLITFPEEYNSWIIKDITVSITFNKVDGNSCANPSHGASYLNELYIYLETPDSTIIHLIDENTFSSIHNDVAGPFKISFNPNSNVNINTLTLSNGTYVSEHLRSYFHGNNVIVHTDWKLIIGDNTLHDPLCYYSSEISLLIEPQIYDVPEYVLCEGNTDSVDIPEITVTNFNIPENLFELYSYGYNNLTLTFNKKSNMMIKRLTDVSLNDGYPIAIPIEIVYAEFVYEGFLVEYHLEANRNDEIWDITLGVDKKDSSGILILKENDEYELKLSLYLQFLFKKNLIKRQLKHDKPPGYKEQSIELNIQGIITILDDYTIQLQ